MRGMKCANCLRRLLATGGIDNRAAFWGSEITVASLVEIVLIVVVIYVAIRLFRK
jgi:hypothetical protein